MRMTVNQLYSNENTTTPDTIATTTTTRANTTSNSQAETRLASDSVDQKTHNILLLSNNSAAADSVNADIGNKFNFQQIFISQPFFRQSNRKSQHNYFLFFTYLFIGSYYY
jgi:hypothetical protein